jgi:hypothetical protein
VDSWGEDSHGGTGLVLEDFGHNRGGLFFVVEFDSLACGGGKASDPFCGTALCANVRETPTRLEFSVEGGEERKNGIRGGEEVRGGNGRSP